MGPIKKAILIGSCVLALAQATNQSLIPASQYFTNYGSKIQKIKTLSQDIKNFIPPAEKANMMDIEDYLLYSTILSHAGIFLGTENNSMPIKQSEREEGNECQYYMENTYANFISLIEKTNRQNLALRVRGASGKKQFRDNKTRYGGHVWLEIYKDKKWIPFEPSFPLTHDLESMLDIFGVNPNEPWKLIDPFRGLALDSKSKKYKPQYTFQITPEGKFIKKINPLNILTDYSGYLGYRNGVSS